MPDKLHNIEKVYLLSDLIDRKEGRLAYSRYNEVLHQLAKHYGFGFTQSVAAFVSLSPTSDYVGNLRSLVSVMIGINSSTKKEDVVVSTYNRCKLRAWDYLIGDKDFLAETKGPKIKSFYMNILYPENKDYITIDGHMCSIWLGRRCLLKEVAESGIVGYQSKYDKIAKDFKTVSKRHKLIPCQLQATLWFTWKRINNIVFNPQLDLWHNGDHWKIVRKVESIMPFGGK